MTTGIEPSGSEVIVVEHPVRSATALRVKRSIQFLFLLRIVPRLVSYRISCQVQGAGRAFLGASESIGRIPGTRGIYSRQAFYRRTLAACGQDVSIGWMSVFSMPEARVGDGTYIGRRCGIGFAEIGAKVMLADGVQVLSGGREHGRGAEDGESHQEQAQEYHKVRIGDGAWIGTSAVIMADVGPGAIVGAGAVVVKPVPARSVAVGIPARTVKSV